MEDYGKKVEKAAAFLNGKTKARPLIGILTGTGLDEIIGFLRPSVIIPYEEIPGFPVSTVTGHAGKLIIGEAEGKTVMAMQGRCHLYEGYSPREVTFPVRVMQKMGVGRLVITNASGGLDPRLDSGDIMIIEDHLNLTGQNPLTGPNFDEWGLRFPDMVHAYDPEFIKIAESAAARSGILLKKGVYAGLPGPSLETPAEMRFLRRSGADAVGFSTVLEVIAAVHARMKVTALSIITNINDPANPVPACIEEVISVSNAASERISRLLQAVIRDIPENGG